ncbi:MAG: FG-GAP-like repeat-containing protein [Salibacteraceae bacterium]
MKGISFIFGFIFILQNVGTAQPAFELVSEEVGINSTYSFFPVYGSGLSFRDFDQDGWDDISLCDDPSGTMSFYKNYFGTFKLTGIGLPGYYHENYVSWIDYNNDGFLDLYFMRELGGTHLLKSDSAFNQTIETNNAGLQVLNNGFREGAVFADFNNDGLLDLFVSGYSYNIPNKLFFQDSNHFFQDISVQSNISDSLKATFHAVAIDYNNDGLLDLYLANDFYDVNEMYRNNGDSTFTEVGAETGTNLALDAMGLAVGDFDGDLDLDIHITDRYTQSRLLRNDGDGTFTEVGVQHGVDYEGGFGWGNNFFDADLYVSGIMIPFISGEPSVLFINDGQGNFDGDTLFGDSLFSFSNSVGDFNNDRLTDIVTVNSMNNPASVWENTTNTTAARFSLKLRGCTSNRDGFGSTVRAYDGSDTRLYSYHSSQSFQCQNSDRKIIPILNNATLDSLKVFWPNGNISTYYDIQPNQSILAIECADPAPYAVIKVDNYAEHELVLCPNDTIHLELDGNYPDVQWSNGATTLGIDVFQSGTYNVTVTNQFGVEEASTQPITVRYFERPSYDAQVDMPSCFNNGFIGLEPNVSNANYTYVWSNGATSDTLTNLTPGTYFVTISNQGYCPVVDSFILTGPDSLNPLISEAETSNPDCFQFNNGSINISVEGGTPPYSYQWSHGASAPTINVGAGTYSLTISDSLDCSIDTSFVLTQPDLLFVFPLSTPDTNFTSTGKAWVEIDGGTPPYAIQWDDSLMQTGDTSFNLKSQVYNVNVMDQNGCDTSVSIKVSNVNELSLGSLHGNEAINCTMAGNNVFVEYVSKSRALRNLQLYDLKGSQVEINLQPQTSGKLMLELNKTGVFILRDLQTGKSCKLINL